MRKSNAFLIFFEHCLWKSRLFVIFAVIASILAGILMIGLGGVSVVWDFMHFNQVFVSNDALETAHKTIMIHAITAMDMFLIATVLFIFGIGLYDLFVQKIDAFNTEDSPELVVSSLEQLKEKLVKVIQIVLVVTLFKYAISFSYTSILDLLYLAISILLIAIATFLGRLKLK